MKGKSWLKYFTIISLLLIVVFGGGYFLEGMKENYYRGGFNPFIIMIGFYVGIGLLLGLEHLIHEKNKEGYWKINLPKIILMGVPSLYFSLALILYINLNVFSFPLRILMGIGIDFMSIFQIVLGYSIITSFYKIDEKEERW